VKENPKQEIAIIWFKRDLRFTDHAPLYYAQQQALPVLLIYCFEPSVMQYADSEIFATGDLYINPCRKCRQS
jgi:deoxyribodipyrimidine photolyase